MHFERLNYSFSNETTEIELNYLHKDEEKVLCIAGSGSRFTPLLSQNPKIMDVVDTSLLQLYLAQVRYKAIQKLEFHEYLKLLGYVETTILNRCDIFLKLNLPDEVKNFWMNQDLRWQKNGFLFIGRWEQKLQILRKIFFLFHFQNLESMFLENNKESFPNKSWQIFCRTILSEKLVSQFLYSGSSSYNLDISFGQYIYQNIINRIGRSRLDEEFFLQFLFAGKLLSQKSWPLEASEKIFDLCKHAQTQVQFIHKSLIDLAVLDYNFYSLSDCFSYLPTSAVQSFLDRIQKRQTRVYGVFRQFMFQHQLNLSRFKQVEKVDSELEKVPVYKIEYFHL